ncbi:MAG: ubiquinol-cytochrome c reductase iron-sulfur subunit [Bacteroidota bacterium]
MDLTADDYSDLQEEGGYVYENDIIIAYLGNDEYFALLKICTHLQCDIEYNADKEIVDYPCHRSEYEIDGDVISGPAEDPLKEYNTELDGQTLRIYEYN